MLGNLGMWLNAHLKYELTNVLLLFFVTSNSTPQLGPVYMEMGTPGR